MHNGLHSLLLPAGAIPTADNNICLFMSSPDYCIICKTGLSCKQNKVVEGKAAVTHRSQQCDTSLKEPCWAGHQLAAAPCNSRQRSSLQQAREWPPGRPFSWRREKGKSSQLRLGAVTALKPLRCQNASTGNRNISGVAG